MDKTQLIAIIDTAVKRAIGAMIVESNSQVKDTYKQTISRLEALDTIMWRLETNKRKLEGMLEEGQLQGKSKSIIRYSNLNTRIDPEEMYEAVCKSLEAHIAADQQEVDEMEAALKHIASDPYYPVIYQRYSKGQSDIEIAEKLFCDESTVRRNRARLIRRLAVCLYGAQAIERN